MIEIVSKVRINGPVYLESLTVLAAIYRLADAISGEKDYLLDPSGGGATEGQRKAFEDKLARERGELPWKASR